MQKRWWVLKNDRTYLRHMNAIKGTAYKKIMLLRIGQEVWIHDLGLHFVANQDREVVVSNDNSIRRRNRIQVKVFKKSRETR